MVEFSYNLMRNFWFNAFGRKLILTLILGAMVADPRTLQLCISAIGKGLGERLGQKGCVTNMMAFLATWYPG